MKFLHFEFLKLDYESDQKVLITVEMNSEDRNDSLETVRNLVTQAVEKANTSNFSNSSYSEDVDETEW